MTKPMRYLIFVILLPSSNVFAESVYDGHVFDLRSPMNLLAMCTIEDDGTIGSDILETTAIGKLFAKGRYERSLFSCVSFIQGVVATAEYLGEVNNCRPSYSSLDLKFHNENLF